MPQSKHFRQSSHCSLFPDWGPLRSAFVARLRFLLSVAYEDRLRGNLKVETNEPGQLAIALCHICVCYMQNESFTYVSGAFFFKRK